MLPGDRGIRTDLPGREISWLTAIGQRHKIVCEPLYGAKEGAGFARSNLCELWVKGSRLTPEHEVRPGLKTRLSTSNASLRVATVVRMHSSEKIKTNTLQNDPRCNGYGLTFRNIGVSLAAEWSNVINVI
jgi:hypothetical protein